MRIKKIVTTAAAVLWIASVAQAQHLWQDPNGWANGLMSYDAHGPKYMDQELVFDMFGSYLHPEEEFNDLFNTDIKHGS